MASCPVALFDGRCLVRGICHVVGCAATLARMCSMSVLELHCLGAPCQPVLPSLSLYICLSFSLPLDLSRALQILWHFYSLQGGRKKVLHGGYTYVNAPMGGSTPLPLPPYAPCPVICLRWLQSECPRVVKQKRKHVDFICLLRFFSF